ncbi:MAG: diguanylate cyclase [Oceanococcus sp.]
MSLATPTTQNLFRRQLDEGFRRLRFVPALEIPYRLDHAQRRSRYTRTGMLIGAGFYALYLAVTWLLADGNVWNTSTFIRIAIILSLLSSAKLIPSMSEKWRTPTVVLAYLGIAAGITSIEIISYYNHYAYRYEGILLSIIHCCFFSGLLFRSCSICISLMLFIYVFSCWFFGLPSESFSMQTFFCLLSAWMGLAAVFLTEHAERENFLNRQLMTISANFDELTGLATRAAFDRYLPSHLRQSALQGTAQQALVLVDIDLFKQLNDTRGHDTGDNCLKLVADIMTERLDVDPRAVARWGGDELIAVCEASDEHALRQRMNGLRQSIEDLQMHNPSAPQGVLTVSIGAVIIPTASRLEEKLLFRQADAALYDAKLAGRNTVVIHDTATAAKLRDSAPIPV